MTQILPLPEDTSLEAIEHAFGCLLKRHDSLRTYFVEVEGKPVQKIAQKLAAPLEVSDAAMPATRVAALLKSEPFQLWHPPLMRLCPVQEEGGRFLVVTLHHIIADAWSLGILQQEFFHFLNAGRHGCAGQLPEPVLQYRDFARWHSALIDDPAFIESSLQFWKTRLAGGVPILEFPMAARGDLREHCGIGYRRLLDKGSLMRLEELAKTHQTTPAVTLLAVFNVALSILTRQTDLACAVITAGRDRDALNHTVGYFTGSLLFKITVDPEEDFVAFLRRVADEMMHVLEHQHFPLELAVQEEGMDMPRLQAAFNMLNVNAQRTAFPNHSPRLGLIEESLEAKFPIELYIEPSSEGLILDWLFQRSFFDRDGIQYIASAFEDVLIQCLAAE